MEDSIKFGVQSPKGTGFDRRPNGAGGKVSYVAGMAGNSKTSGATQKKSIGLTGNSNGRGAQGYGKPGPQKYDHKK